MTRASRAVVLAAALLACCLRHGAADLNATAAAAVVQMSVVNPIVLAQADGIVKAVQQKLLLNTLTGNLNIKGLASDPTVQASFVPLVEAASLASGPLWTAVNPPPVPVAPNATAATKVVAAAAADPATLALAQKLIAAVQASAGLTGWNVQTLAADPTVQAAVVPLLLSTANVSGIEWDKVDGSSLATQKAASFQATAPAAAAGATDLQAQPAADAQPAAAAQQPSLLPALPNIFGRKMQQVILNPGDLVGLGTDYKKATPSAADAARLSAALGLQSATPGQAQQWQQEQQTYKDSVRTSTPATIQNALNNFNGVQMNPSKLYAPGAPPSNNAPLTPQEQGTVAAPQASQPATVVYGKGPNGYVHGGAPVGSVIPLPAQNAQASTQSAQASGPATAQNPQASGPATILSHGSYQQASHAAPSQAMGPAASSGTLQAASSLAAAQNTQKSTQSALASGPATSQQTYPTYQQASSQAATPVAYSDAAASNPEAAAAPSANTVPNSRLNQGVLQRPTSLDTTAAAAPDASDSSDGATAASPVSPSTSYSNNAAATPTTAGTTGSGPVAPATPDSSGAQSLLSSLGGSLADSPGVAPAPPGANFNWLQPSTKNTQVPVSVAQAMTARAPKSSPDSASVRQFVNQAGFKDTPGNTLTQQQADSAAGTGTQQQGRRLAQAPAVSGPPAAAQNHALTARLTNAFGSSATALLNAGASFIADAPNPAPGIRPPASDVVHLLGPAVADVADFVSAPVPAPASVAQAGQATSMGSEVASGVAHAPAMSIERMVGAAAKVPAVVPSAAALAQRGPQLQGPLNDALTAVAGLPGNLGLLPRLPGIPGQPGGSASLQAQQGGPLLGMADTMQTLPGPGRRR